jgi:hypothetical protein
MNKKDKEYVIDVMKRLSTTNTSSEKDALLVQYVLKLMGYTNAVVVSGIV